MRKWILRWLLGGDEQDWRDMYAIACSSHESCKKMLKNTEFMLDRYNAIHKEEIAILEAIKTARDIPDLMVKIIDIMLRSRAKMQEKEEES